VTVAAVLAAAVLVAYAACLGVAGSRMLGQDAASGPLARNAASSPMRIQVKAR